MFVKYLSLKDNKMQEKNNEERKAKYMFYSEF